MGSSHGFLTAITPPGFPGFFLEAPEDNVAALINEWYRLHIADGWPADATQEELIAEALAEEALGGGFSYPPGRA